MDDWPVWTQAAQVLRVGLLVGGGWLAVSLPIALCFGRALRRVEPPAPLGTDAPQGHRVGGASVASPRVFAACATDGRPRRAAQAAEALPSGAGLA
jgi:hypothetical protein